MRYFDVQQGSDDWFELRKGIPTASRFDQILTPVKGEASKSQETLINELIGERCALMPPEGVEHYTNRAMRHGLACEDQARQWFDLGYEHEAFNGGFCVTNDGRFGCSPDSLLGVGEDVGGGVMELVKPLACLELKCPQPATHAEYLRAGTLPNEYRWQCHGHMIVTGTDLVYFMSFCPGFPKQLLLKVERGPDTKRLAEELDRFYEKFERALKLIQGEQV